MLPVLIFTSLLLQVSAQISGQGSTTAEYGGDAKYKCAVANLAGVLQVTWQRLFSDESIENLATYSKRFGQQVNEPYRDKVIFTEASLSSTSITLKNVTWSDDSCYICSFNVYPDGSKRSQTCLKVEGISEVKTDVYSLSSEHEDKDMKEVVFSCSATGKPAPTIKWEFSSGVTAADPPQTATVTNSDHTFTTSSNTTLRVPAGWKGQADCLLNSGMRGERRETIKFDVGPVREVPGEGSTHTEAALIISTVLIISCCVAVTVAVRRKRLKGNRGDENII